MAAPKGNSNAQKPEREHRTARLVVQLTHSEKAQLVKRAKGEKLSDYCRKRLLG